MNGAHRLLAIYLELARVSRIRRRPFVTDRLLLVAGHIAHLGGWPSIESACKNEILHDNPAHALHRYDTIGGAAVAEDFQSILRNAYRRYPKERVEILVARLEIDVVARLSEFPTIGKYIESLFAFCPPRLGTDWE